MLIAFVSPNAWTVHQFRLDIIKALQNDGHTILVVAARDAFADKLEGAGCRFVAIPFNNRSRNPLTDWWLYRRLKKIYAAEKPDLIFHYAIKANIWGSLAAAKNNIPAIAVVTGLGYPFAHKKITWYFAKAGYRLVGQHAREVWFLNNADADTFRELDLVPSHKIKLLPGEGINTNYFQRQAPYLRRQAHPFRFILCSRLLKSKGITRYAQSIAALQQKGYAVEGWLLGLPEPNHPDKLPMADLEQWQRKGWIQYKGASDDVRLWLEQADAYAFTSYYSEGIPRSLMEAASMELPVVVPDLRGCRDLVKDGISGFVFSGSNQQQQNEALQQKMENILRLSADARNAMGAAGRALMQAQFDTSRVIVIYRETIAKSS